MKRQPQLRRFFLITLFAFTLLTPLTCLRAQDYVTGAFEGQVTDGVTNAPVAGATVQIINKDTGVPVARQTDSQGRFRQGLLPPGDYVIRVSRQGYATYEREQSLPALRPTPVVPVPVKLQPEVAVAPMSGVAPPKDLRSPSITAASAALGNNEESIRAEINTTDAQRGGNYSTNEVSTLPLGATTLTRTFDELGLLLPGVALPPQTQGSVTGPGIGPGVGSAGQFAVNGLRSRANNFTVDGSDNNDEDIGVRRQGFLALVPQPIESIKEFQMITLLAPAQYGRNIGAQVNAISKSGTNATHGAIYGLFNSSQLNSREFFDTTNGNALIPLVAGNNQPVLNCGTLFEAACIAAASTHQIRVRNPSGGKDSSTLGQGGVVLGGPLVPEAPGRPGRSMFYFFSVEGHTLNATKEQSFAVPTVAQRGLFGSGASGVTFTPFTDVNGVYVVNSPNFFYPTTVAGDILFSYFPFPNNPKGIYGGNTLTQVLPASGQGRIFSGKVDGNFRIRGKQQSVAARYNFTQDWREVPVTGNAIFSTVRPRVRTQNFSTFLNSDLSGANSVSPLSNQLRLSYGRTRLDFESVPDRTGFLLPSSFGAGGLLPYAEPEAARFLLNAPVFENFTLPAVSGNSITPNTGPVLYLPVDFTTENRFAGFGPVGQVSIAGFSPVGVDVFNFPQRRVDNTYQLADNLTLHRGYHNFVFGTDIRRTELNSDLPRNTRPLITVNGAPQLTGTPITRRMGGDLIVTGFTNLRLGNSFTNAIDLAAAGVTSGFFQTLSTRGTSHINLRYYQFNFFGQDEWRVRQNLSLAYGLRYEYNTPPRELSRRIESTFNDPLLSLVNLGPFIAGRSHIFEPDRNDFAPRVSVAWSPNPSAERATVIRAGYGLFYDQNLGAVVSQSRNVFPNFLTANFAGGGFGNLFGNLSLPFCPCAFQVNPNLLSQSVLGAIAPGLTLQQAIDLIGVATGRGAGTFGATLPVRSLKTPMAHQYGVTVEWQLSRGVVVSSAYVGTLGRNLPRFTTPNLGPNELILPLAMDALSTEPLIYGYALAPGIRVGPGGTITGGRPFSNVGVVNVFDSTARSRYDALQVQLRGRLRFRAAAQYQVSYTLSRANDDASDVFDLAGSPSLPQNSLTFAGEYAPSNFDARHRVAYNYVFDLPRPMNQTAQAILGNIQVAGSGQFQTGQPFTVNSINDVNLDGNLTDRVNTTSGIVQTRDRSQPLRLTVNPATLLAPVGQDGKIPRNSFRSSNLWLTNAAVIKTIRFSEQFKLVFRTEIFNVFNRANYGVPVRLLEAPGFGKATDTVTPGRRIQFGLKLVF